MSVARRSGRGRPGPTSLVSRDQPIYFTGTRALEVRPGFVTLDIPLLDRWAEPLGRLTREQRERFEEAEFYELLQREVATRLRLLPAAPG